MSSIQSHGVGVGVGVGGAGEGAGDDAGMCTWVSAQNGVGDVLKNTESRQNTGNNGYHNTTYKTYIQRRRNLLYVSTYVHTSIHIYVCIHII